MALEFMHGSNNKMILFFKKKLILKTSLLLFLFIAISLFSNFFYNLNRGILASNNEEEEIEIDYEKLKCGREIPVGEAMEKTWEFLEEIIRELERIEANSYYLIKTQEEMEELAKKCSMENCTPACEEVPIYDVWGGEPLYYQCLRQPCKGDPCDKEKIEELFSEITNFNEEIQAAKEKLDKLIYKSVEPLCTKENEDIRTLGEKIRCVANPFCWELTRETLLSLLPEDFLEKINLCPSITVQKAIGRKLDLSRAEFDNCYISPADIEKVILGEKTGKYLFNCPFVLEQDFPRYTKTLEEMEIEGEETIEMPICTSFYNWFCCTDTP